MSAAIDISIVIVNWNVADLLAQCLDSIQRSPVRIVADDAPPPPTPDGPTVEVIVVDSASHDHSLPMLRERYPWVQLIACPDNIGFVRGTNLGTAQAKGQAIFWLNPDTELHDDALPQLWTTLQREPDIGAVGPHTLNADGTHQSTRRRFPTLGLACFESTWLEGMVPPGQLRRFRVQDKPDDDVYPVDWVQGSALMLKRAVYEEIGGFDERYIMYSEELDWCRRAVAAGWQVWYVGTARITHYSGQSTSQVEARSHIHFQHSKLRYFRKFHGWGAALVLRLVIGINYTAQLGLEGVKWLVGHKRPLRAGRVRVYWAVLRSLLGAGEKVAQE